MPKNKTINYLELPANDFAAVKAFFTAVFGWTFEDYGADYLAFHGGTIDGGFYRSDLISSTENGATLIVFYADDIDDVIETVKSHGGNIVKDTFAFPGGKRFHFADPHGNEFAVWSDK